MKLRVVLLLLAATVLLLGGCSSLNRASAPAPATTGYSTDMAAPAPAAPPVAQSAESGAAQTAWDRYVIRTGDVALVVKDVEAAAEQVKQVAADAGGFVSGSNVRRDARGVVADLTIQVPAESFDQVVSNLRDLATIVESVRTGTQDVTEEFVDNEAALLNLRSAEESTRRLLDQTSRMEDIVTVQRELTRIRGEIERIEGRQRYLKRRVELSTVNVRLAAEAGVSLASARSEWQPLRTVRTAWEASLTFISGALDGIIAVAVFSWWAVPLVVGLLYLVRRRRRRPPASPPVASEEG